MRLVFLTFRLETNSSEASQAGRGGFLGNLWLLRAPERQQILGALSSAVLVPSSGMFFSPVQDLLSLPTWWNSYLIFKTELKCPFVLGKHLPFPPSFSKQSSFPPRFVYTCILWLLPPEYCWLLCIWRSLFLWELLESGDRVVLFSESPVLC